MCDRFLVGHIYDMVSTDDHGLSRLLQPRGFTQISPPASVTSNHVTVLGTSTRLDHVHVVHKALMWLTSRSDCLNLPPLFYVVFSFLLFLHCYTLGTFTLLSMTANNSSPITNNHAVAPTDKHRRKRLKVVSACLECRRKKTKCNGETPCAGCIKAKVDCKYVATLQQQQHAPRSSRSSAAPVARHHHQQQHTSHQHHATTTTSMAATSTSSGSNNTTAQANRATVSAIEQRLTVIEDILRALLKDRAAASSFTAQGYFVHSHSSLQSSYTASVHHASHVHNWYPTRDAVYSSSPSSSSSTFSSTTSSAQPAQPTSAFHLPPLRQQHSSAPTTSIRSLLNDNDDLPTPPPTATFFEKETPVSNGTRHYAEYYMTP